MSNRVDHNQKASFDWREANTEAIIASNDWVDAHGLPLHAHRLF